NSSTTQTILAIHKVVWERTNENKPGAPTSSLTVFNNTRMHREKDTANTALLSYELHNPL
ncbi:hypothetical protein L9F63_013589, partial [Diploptera punctata]